MALTFFSLSKSLFCHVINILAHFRRSFYFVLTPQKKLSKNSRIFHTYFLFFLAFVFKDSNFSLITENINLKFFFCSLFHHHQIFFTHTQMNSGVKWLVKMRSFNLYAIHFHGLPSTVPAMVERHMKASSVHSRKASKKKVSNCMQNVYI